MEMSFKFPPPPVTWPHSPERWYGDIHIAISMNIHNLCKRVEAEGLQEAMFSPFVSMSVDD